MSTFAGLQERLEKLNDLKKEGVLSAEEHGTALRGVLSSFGLGEAISQGGDSGFGESADDMQNYRDGNSRDKHVEILIHNLSHADMALSVDLNTPGVTFPLGKIMARPQFGEYRNISERLWNGLEQQQEQQQQQRMREREASGSGSGSTNTADSATATSVPAIRTIHSPLFTRSQVATNDGRYPIADLPQGAGAGAGSTVGSLPVGFDLSQCPVPVSVNSLKFKGGSGPGPAWSSPETGGEENHTTCGINGIYFPLLAVLVHKWLETLEHNGQLDSRKILILISGRGTPTDPKARSVDNSTKCTAKLAQRLLRLEYPDLQVITLHSTTNLFRYDENIVFVKRELVPIVDHIRNDLAHNVGEKWKEAMGVTLSFADGSSARVSAINQSLSHYRPSYMHFWQLKTFWAEGKLCADDIESHSFEEISTQPALTVEQTSSTVRMTVAAMQQFRSEFECLMQESSTKTDLADFWLRKSKKPVLAVLLVQKPGCAPKLYRGTNMEVSMPTGSLCAERNVIGSALADDITLRRQDLKMIAVYSARSLEPPKESKSPHSADSQSHSQSQRMYASSSNAFPGHGYSAGAGFRAAQFPPEDSTTPGTGEIFEGRDRRSSGSGGGKAEVTFSLECLPCGGGGGGGENTTSSAAGANLRVDIPFNRQMKRSWSETSADSTSSSTGNGGSKLEGPRSPVMAGQKRKILSMPSQGPNGLGGSSSSSGSSGLGAHTPKGSSSGGGGGTFPSSGYGKDGGGILGGISGNGNLARLHMLGGAGAGGSGGGAGAGSKMRRSFSNGQLLGNNRHEIFNMGDTYEPEREDDGPGGGGGGGDFGGSQATKTRSFVVHESDMNPLKPCGACLEWLKKISSVNPGFQVITFTDYQCEGVYQEIIADA